MRQVLYSNPEKLKFAGTRNMIGLINIEEILYKVLLFTFFKTTQLHDKHISCTVFAMQCPIFVSLKYGQPKHILRKIKAHQ